ncbi:MAG: hypothetical protein EX271_10045 [Acidimicrobiales bacterium]|nr:hypothetical protein [Hyphomonadaceae bacterium]RZV40587.1 MAG: hypothetical protein EX271_10045 [Acidimicrobiales bacterium]
MRMPINKRLFATLVLSGMVSGCASINMPDLDFIKIPEFKEEAENLGGYPNVEDAPQVPTDIRSDAQWDKDAKQLMAKRDSFGPVPEGEPMESDAEFNKRVDDLVAKVEEYKLDDPQ